MDSVEEKLNRIVTILTREVELLELGKIQTQVQSRCQTLTIILKGVTRRSSRNLDDEKGSRREIGQAYEAKLPKR
jgi:hypothetical protein